MSRQTMSFALPESMREYIDNRVAAGNYGNTSEYIRDLVRRDQEEQAKKRLRDLIEEGLASGPGRRRTKADEKELLAFRSRRDRFEPAELRTQALRDQQGEVRYDRKEGGSRVAVKVAKATNAALDQIELDPGIGSPTLGKRLGIPGLRT
jgi:putative addiction module CopG family antidote